jgi:hypothetical protein
MALPTFNDLTGLDVSFNGEPFCNVSTGTTSINGLDSAYEGEPFSGTEATGGGGDVEIQPEPGLITLNAVFAGFKISLPSSPGVIASAGVCGNIEVGGSSGITILPPAGMVAATGLLSGIWQKLSSPVGRADVDGRCGCVATATVIKPAPGEINATAVAPGIRHKICIPPTQIASCADISGLLCFLMATPATGLISGGTAGRKCFSVTAGVKRRYECRIQCDGFNDINVPVSAFSSRLRHGYPSYSEITIPGLQHYSKVAARRNGYFVVSAIISKGGEDLLREDIFNAPIDKISITGNQFLQHMVLSGTRPMEENPGPQTVPLRGIIYRRLSYGDLSLRSAITDLYLKPGDTVTYDGDSFTARTITHSLSSSGSFMEVREADG